MPVSGYADCDSSDPDAWDVDGTVFVWSAATGEGWVKVPLTMARPARSGASDVACVCGRLLS